MSTARPMLSNDTALHYTTRHDTTKQRGLQARLHRMTSIPRICYFFVTSSIFFYKSSRSASRTGWYLINPDKNTKYSYSSDKNTKYSYSSDKNTKYSYSSVFIMACAFLVFAPLRDACSSELFCEKFKKCAFVGDMTRALLQVKKSISTYGKSRMPRFT